MEFRLLGPVELGTATGPVDLGTARERHVVAVLAAEAGRPVPVGTLIERVWGPDAPAGARATLRVYLSHIRKTIGKANAEGDRAAELVRRPGGYLLDIDTERVDLHRFRRLVAQARDARRTDDERATLLREALDLPDGEPLADLAGDWVDRTRLAFSREYLEAALDWARATLSSGHGGSAVDRLAELADRHPLNELLAAALMRALHAAGRSSEALRHYADVQVRLRGELGTDPGAELQQVHGQILRGQPTLPRQRDGGRVVPAQLPADVPRFAGRREHLDRLDALLPGPAATLVAAVDGTAGVGKTTLAVHWAHRIRDRFPDGQLYANLRGFDAGGQMTAPATAVRGFLDALAVPPQRVPADPDAQAALYRSLLAGKRMLVVLDNARDSAQVRPLLPGAPGCLVLVTSRNKLTSLIAAHGAHPVSLDPLTPDEARNLLADRLGTGRTAAEPDAVAEIVGRCAGLPLALALVAAHAAVRPDTSLRTLAEQLHDTRRRWQALTGDDPATDVRTVFSWSYATLTPGAARLFRELGLHPGPDLGVPAAASLTGLPVEQVRPLLAELVRANLISGPTRGRYTMHDLLREYAAQLARTEDTDEQRHAAIHRILDHYLHSANAADRLLYPAQDPLTLPVPRPGVGPEYPTGQQQARDWFTAEHAVLVATVEYAAATGFDTHTWQLAWTLRLFLDRRGHWHDWVATTRAALAAAERLADSAAQVWAHRLLARPYLLQGRLDEAERHLGRALELAMESGDRLGQAYTRQTLGHLWQQRGDPAQALEHIRQAYDLYRAVGHERGQARALNNIGWVHSLLGDHRQALTACRQALTLHENLDDRDGQAATWDSIGYAHQHLGDHAEALACYDRALTVVRDLGDRYFEADVLTHVADAHRSAGDLAAARDTYRQALVILDALDHPDADAVRTRLGQLER